MRLVLFLVFIAFSSSLYAKETAKVSPFKVKVDLSGQPLSEGFKCIEKVCKGIQKRDLSSVYKERKELKKSGLDKTLDKYFEKAVLKNEKLLTEMVAGAVSQKEKDYFTNLISVSQSNKKGLYKVASQNCLAKASLAYRNAPSAKTIESFESRFEAYKTNFLITLELLASKEDSLPKFKKFLAGLSLNYGKNSQSNYASDFSKLLANQNGNKKTKRQAEKFFQYMFDEYPEATKAEHKSMLLAAAENLGLGCPAGFEDQLMLTMDSSVLSSSEFVVKFPEVGEGVAYHELAHAFVFYTQGLKKEGELSASTSSEIKRISQCLQKKHYKPKKPSRFRAMKGLPQSKRGSNKGSFYLGEDLADIISARTIKTTGGKNSFCQFTVENFSLTNEHEEEVHSSMFFRIIQTEQAINGKVPKSCQKAVKKERVDKSFFKDCLGK